MEYAELARAESERGEIVLREREEDNGNRVLELRVNGVFVMDTAETSSEQALATQALAVCASPRRVLVGGLGLGYTARQLLCDPRVERVEVAELEEALIEWMRNGVIAQGPSLLEDPRIRVLAADVAAVASHAAPGSYDLVLLDVDNGPDYLVHEANAELYHREFLELLRRITSPHGTVAIWSANPSEELRARMREVFGDSAEAAYDVRLQGLDQRYYLYLSRRSEPRKPT